MEIEELRDSSARIGQFYPVLVDYHGQIIDGEHRLKANKEWKRMKLNYIKTDKELLIARLVCNIVRRKASKKEKTNILTKLADIHLAEGTPPGKICYEIAFETGMSYRWVTKHLPLRFKDYKQSIRKKGLVAHRATNLKDPPKDVIDINVYKNTNFVNLRIDKKLYERIYEKAEELKTTAPTLLYNAILFVLAKL